MADNQHEQSLAKATRPLQNPHEEETRKDPKEVLEAQREEVSKEPDAMSPPPTSINQQSASPEKEINGENSHATPPLTTSLKNLKTNDLLLTPKEIATLKCNILMKEIDIRSAEINARIPAQMQTIASWAVLSGGFIALAAFLFNNQKPVIPFLPWAPLIGLIYSFIVLTFAWMNLDHDIHMANNGNYLEEVVRNQLCEILGRDKTFFSWGYYRTHKSMRFSGKKRWWNNLSFKIVSVSRYGFTLPAGITWLMAFLITVTQWNSKGWDTQLSLFQLKASGWTWGKASIALAIFTIFVYGFLVIVFPFLFRQAIRKEKARIFGQYKSPEYWKTLQDHIIDKLGLTKKEIEEKLANGQKIVEDPQKLLEISIEAEQKGHKLLVTENFLTPLQSSVEIRRIQKWDEATAINYVTHWFLEH